MLARHVPAHAHRTAAAHASAANAGRPRAAPDPIRVAAGSAALLINALAALLLLQPRQWSELTLPMRPSPPPTEVVLIPQTTIPLPPTPAPPAPPVAEVRHTPLSVPQPTLTPQLADPVFAAPPTVPALSSDFIGDPAPPVSPPSGTREASIDYAFAPPPPYPAAALRSGAEGTVWLRIEVDESGAPVRVTVERSSGNHALDNGARSHVLNRWRFEPARRDGEAMRGVALVPVTFAIERR